MLSASEHNRPAEGVRAAAEPVLASAKGHKQTLTPPACGLFASTVVRLLWFDAGQELRRAEDFAEEARDGAPLLHEPLS